MNNQAVKCFGYRMHIKSTPNSVCVVHCCRAGFANLRIRLTADAIKAE